VRKVNKMMKVHINRKPVSGPWGGGNLWVKAAYELLPLFNIQLVDIHEKPDVIIVVGLGRDENCISAIDAINYKRMRLGNGENVKLILRVNENDARKGTRGLDETIMKISENVDHTVFVSNWLKQYFESPPHAINHHVVYNGVDSEVFCRHERMNNGKINIVTHHWSDNFLKGFDVYDAIDRWIEYNKDFTFTYIGRERGSFKHTNVIKPLFGKALGTELAKYDVYISASRHDPGPNHIIESLACHIPTYVHVDGGGCVEFAGVDHVYKDVDELLNIISSKQYHVNTSWSPTDWLTCIRQFVEISNL